VDECIGCRYCQLACPWDVPTSDWNSHAPKISKCTHCADRIEQPVPIAFNGQALSGDENKRFSGSIATPACVKACPADALLYGTREEMLAVAHKRIAARPDKYVNHVYGEKELGGTSVLYLSRVPFEKLGFPTYGDKPFPAFTKTALGAVPPAVIGVGAMLGAFYALFRKRVQKVADDAAASRHSPDHGHVEFEPLKAAIRTPFNWLLLLLIAFGAITFVARFALGLGGSTNLSDTYPWGLWILFDLVWIAVRRRRVRDGRRDLRLPAKGSLRARPHGRPDGPLELLLRDGHAARRPRPAVARLPARAAGAGTLGDVRGVMVRRSVRHDPPARIPAGAVRALWLHARG
jgi:formate dehydrogenase iron-sulfur subunit